MSQALASVWRRATGDDRRALTRRAAAYEHARGGGEESSAGGYLLVDTDHGVYCVDSADRGVSQKLFVKRRSAVQAVLKEVLRTLDWAGRAPASGALFLDVGAHVGSAVVFAIRACGFGGGLAFEPEPGNSRLLRVNLLLNELEESVTAFEAAVSDRDGRMSLRVNPKLHGGHSLVDTAPGATSRGKPVIEVESITLASALRRGGADPAAVGLVKIDGQGQEAEILEGAGPLVEAGVPVVLEYWPSLLEERGTLDRFEQIVGQRFDTAFDLGTAVRWSGGGVPAPLAAGEIGQLRARYTGKKKGDLLLIRS